MIDVWQYPKYASLLRSVFTLDFTTKILLKPLETKTTRIQTFETQTWTLFLFKDAGIWVFGCAIGNRFYWWSFFFNPSQIWGMVLWKCILFMYDKTSWVEITEVTKRWLTVAGDWGIFHPNSKALGAIWKWRHRKNDIFGSFLLPYQHLPLFFLTTSPYVTAQKVTNLWNTFWYVHDASHHTLNHKWFLLNERAV